MRRLILVLGLVTIVFALAGYSAEAQGPKEIERLEVQVEQLRAAIIDLRVQLAVLRSELDDTRREGGSLGQLQRDIAVLQSQVDDLRKVGFVIIGGLLTNLVATFRRIRNGSGHRRDDAGGHE